ncbi:MAG: UDP-N-acetylglucosamine 2-epimerase (non-hydrolyzing) [Bacteroidota bacterium]
MKKILICVGTRPNFIKITKLEDELQKLGDYEIKLLHTGQHFDQNMSEVFFQQLKLRSPDFFLGINSSSHSEVVGKIIIEAEKVMLDYKPDAVIVPGDVNSTFACAFAASSLRIPVAHIESGLRSYDMDMPEERNRVLTDSLSDLLFVTEAIGLENLKKEGYLDSKVYLVGNTMIDSVKSFEGVIDQNQVVQQLRMEEKGYILTSFHRPINVDHPESLTELLKTLKSISSIYPIVFPIHPRTSKNVSAFELDYLLEEKNIHVIQPQGYLEFMKLLKNAKAVISDSGGIQAEASYFGTPCVTVRDTTELKVTLTHGTNNLSALTEEAITKTLNNALVKKNQDIPYWDGKSSVRIAEVINRYLHDNG